MYEYILFIKYYDVTGCSKVKRKSRGTITPAFLL